jgi:hypothetical protein
MPNEHGDRPLGVEAENRQIVGELREQAQRAYSARLTAEAVMMLYRAIAHCEGLPSSADKASLQMPCGSI